ncbi:MAG: 3'-phosphoesterase, partial [Archaeoglobaceae archaeon]|nr:3'-phosphoesterase [Archaeoglobaceae archaeon]
IDYMEFEGMIEEGYGKGIVKLWDKGEYEILKRTEKEIKFKLSGNKLKGVYVLIKFEKMGKNSWLMIKLSD